MERVEAVVEEKGEQVTDEDESGSHSDESQAEEADTESHKDEKVRVMSFVVSLVVVVVVKGKETLVMERNIELVFVLEQYCDEK